MNRVCFVLFSSPAGDDGAMTAAYLGPLLGHLVAGVHVLRVADGHHSPERLDRRAAVHATRTHAHGAVEPVLVHLRDGGQRRRHNHECARFRGGGGREAVVVVVVVVVLVGDGDGDVGQFNQSEAG